MNDPLVKIPQTFKQGLKAFNRQSFYEAHEYFEAAWRETKDKSREFYRALFQLSGGFFRLTQGKPDAARKFFALALGWLQKFSNEYLGCDIASLRNNLETLIDAIDHDKKSEVILKRYSQPIYLKGPK